MADVTGRNHSPGFALFAALLVPGGGQAYNGRPFKALFFLLTSALVLPWIWSLFDARREARRVRESGGRFGRGGCLWVFLQIWLVGVIALAARGGLTGSGVGS